MSIDTSNLIDNSNLNDENSTISPYSDDTFMKIKSRLRSDSGKRQQQQQQQQQQHQQQQGRGSGLRFGGSSGLKLTSLSENLQANDNVNSNTEELLRKRNADDIIEEMDSTFISQQANVVGSKTPIKPLVSSPFKPSNSSFLNSVNANTSYRSSATTSTPASINKQHHEFSQLSNFPNMSKISSFNNNSNHNNHNNLTSNSPTRHDYNQSHISPLRYNTSNIGDISQIQNKSIFVF
ncbi:unnamed protein product [[Candida] boidinii]|nr:unnamed protein product [[Candida] boidinii]